MSSRGAVFPPIDGAQYDRALARYCLIEDPTRLAVFQRIANEWRFPTIVEAASVALFVTLAVALRGTGALVALAFAVYFAWQLLGTVRMALFAQELIRLPDATKCGA